MTIHVYLNGEYMPVEKAKISVMDRGFLFGDAVYEVVPVYDGACFLLDAHLDRLFYSLLQINMCSPLSKKQWADIIKTLIEKSDKHPLLSVYIHVTRGVPERRNHTYEKNLEPTVYIKCAPAIVRDYSKGIKAITVEEFRWGRCDIKSTNLLANILMKQQAKDAGALEAIIIKNGDMVEASSSNVFIVKNGVLKTPPLSHALLGGVTRERVITLAIKHNIPFEQVRITEAQLRDADEVWITGSSKEIAPVVTLDDHAVGDGAVGVLASTLLALYRQT
jgi:D-alanine transaminase